MPPIDDRYGEKEYGDWEDPYIHALITMCSGCPMCVTWEGRLYDDIRAEREALVCRRRARTAGEPTTSQVARDDRDYWNERYAG